MGMGIQIILSALVLYTTAVVYSAATLLRPCEGEDLQDCVKGAESILLDTNLTFPDDNETLQSVCSMWDEMTDCAYNYTARCLTPKENSEFHLYFEEPMSSMKKVCTDSSSTQEYFRHAHCIKTISTVDKFCGQQYGLLISHILSITVNTMKKICCALSDFKDCVVQKDLDHACGIGPDHDHETDGEISSFALRTLEKSLLAFVSHSCQKEGFSRAACLEEERFQASNEVETILMPAVDRSTNHLIASGATLPPKSGLSALPPIPITPGKTEKTLLVPVMTSTVGPEYPAPFPDMTPQVNISIPGERGGKALPKANKKGTVGSENGVNKNGLVEAAWGVNKDLEAKIRNVSNLWSRNKDSSSIQSSDKYRQPHAEKQVSDMAATAGATEDEIKNSTLDRASKGVDARAGHGRALNLASSVEDEAAEGQKKAVLGLEGGSRTNGTAEDQTPTGPVIISNFTSPSFTPSITVPIIPPTIPAEASKKPNALQNTSAASIGASLATVSSTPLPTTMEKLKETVAGGTSSGVSSVVTITTAVTPTTTRTTTTTPAPVTAGGMKNDTRKEPAGSGGDDSKLKKKTFSSMYNATRRAGAGSKNKSHVPVSHVPVRVFLIWLSTFFV